MNRAEELFSRIPFGHAEPLKRPADSYTDRGLRRMVEEANNKGDCIINVGSGYYRPLPQDEVDEKEYHEYMKQELSRARKIHLKRSKMRVAYEKRRYIEEVID